MRRGPDAVYKRKRVILHYTFEILKLKKDVISFALRQFAMEFYTRTFLKLRIKVRNFIKDTKILTEST